MNGLLKKLSHETLEQIAFCNFAMFEDNKRHELQKFPISSNQNL